MTGFITLHRKILEWEWWGDLPTQSLFIFLLLKSNHKDKNWQGRLIRRGQFLTGRKKLAAESGLSEQQVRTALDKLKTTGEITIKSTNKDSIITITNYDEYQSNQPAINQQDNQQATTTNNENNVNNENKSITPLTPQGEKKTDDDFEQFWTSFPRQRRGDKQVAQRKWNAALKKGYTVDQIMQGVINYQHSREVAEFYAMNAASWLHNAKFLDNYRPPKNKAPEVNKWDEAREKIKRGEL